MSAEKKAKNNFQLLQDIYEAEFSVEKDRFVRSRLESALGSVKLLGQITESHVQDFGLALFYVFGNLAYPGDAFEPQLAKLRASMEKKNFRVIELIFSEAFESMPAAVAQ